MPPFRKEQRMKERRILTKFVLEAKSDTEIAKYFNCTKRNITHKRKVYSLQTIHKTTKINKIRKAICDLLNKEDAMEPYSDYDLADKLNMKRRLLTWHRMKLKIPAKRNNFGVLTRKYIYLTKDRVIWMPNGNHVYAKTGDSLWKRK